MNRYSLHVKFNAKTRRRWLGSLCLLAAIVMLVVGETTPGKRLGDVAFVVYWLVCFLFTALAMLAAVLDAHALRREARAEQRRLLEITLEEIRAGKTPNPKLQPPANPQAPGPNSTPSS